MPPVPLPNRRDGDTLPPSSWEETKRFLNEREGAETKADPHPEFVHLGKGTGSEVEVQERQDKKAAAAAHFPKNPNRTSRRTPSCLPPLLPLNSEEDSFPSFAEKKGEEEGGKEECPGRIPFQHPFLPLLLFLLHHFCCGRARLIGDATVVRCSASNTKAVFSNPHKPMKDPRSKKRKEWRRGNKNKSHFAPTFRSPPPSNDEKVVWVFPRP